MIEHSLWHPVALASDVAAIPVAVHLLNVDVVLWRDASGVVHAWQDRCPHRGAKLSLGRVQGNTLECAYHGWIFDASAHCTRVPALPSFMPPASHCATQYLASEQHGMVWVSFAEPLQAVPSLALGTAQRVVHCGPYDVATSAPRVVENFLDMAHFGFVHEGYLGARDATGVADYAVERTSTGLRASGCKAWQPQSNVHAQSGADVSYTYEVISPYCAMLTKVPDPSATVVNGQPANWRESIALWVCPASHETSRVWFSLAVIDTTSAAQVLRDFQNTIFAQDKPVLESQSPKRLPIDLRGELHTTADKASAAYRRFLADTKISFGVC